MNILQFETICCGCGSCAQICPKEAIRMESDQNGFLYPKLDSDKCVECGLCIKHCPVSAQTPHHSIDAFYGWNRDTELRMQSSSGGIFSAFAQTILDQGGIVYGAVFDALNKKVLYKSTETVGLDDLRRSKYAEADTAGAFSAISKQLQADKPVLFCGTPCHVAGLLSFLGKDYPNLYTCDFVCGGNASPAFLQEHLQKLEKKYGAPIKSINFRDKRCGWKRMLLTITFENGKQYSKLNWMDSFFNGFVEGITKRENCYACPFADNHYADLTIADYWGYRNAGVPYDEKGISMLVVNTQHGAALKAMTEQKLELTQMGLERTRYTIRPRVLNPQKLAERNAFFADASNVGFLRAAKRSYQKHPFLDVLLSYLHLK